MIKSSQVSFSCSWYFSISLGSEYRSHWWLVAVNSTLLKKRLHIKLHYKLHSLYTISHGLLLTNFVNDSSKTATKT